MKTNEQLSSCYISKMNEKITQKDEKSITKIERKDVDAQQKDQENVPQINDSIEAYPKPIKVITSGLRVTAFTDNGHHGVRGQAS